MSDEIDPEKARNRGAGRASAYTDSCSHDQECTDPPDLSARARKDLQVATAPKKSKEAQQVKLADKLHNLRSILEDPPVGWTAKRCQDYFRA